MIRRPPRSTRTDTLFPYTTLFRSTDFNIGLNWRLTPRWSLSAAFYQSRGSRRSPFILDPLVTETPFISLPRHRSVFLPLRYERSAGRPQGVIGGAPGGPTGTGAGSLLDRKRVGSGKSVSIRLDLGGGRITKKKTNK